MSICREVSNYPEEYKKNGWHQLSEAVKTFSGNREYKIITVGRHYWNSSAVGKLFLAALMTLMSLGLVFAFKTSRHLVENWWTGLQKEKFKMLIGLHGDESARRAAALLERIAGVPLPQDDFEILELLADGAATALSDEDFDDSLESPELLTDSSAAPADVIGGASPAEGTDSATFSTDGTDSSSSSTSATDATEPPAIVFSSPSIEEVRILAELTDLYLGIEALVNAVANSFVALLALPATEDPDLADDLSLSAFFTDSCLGGVPVFKSPPSLKEEENREFNLASVKLNRLQERQQILKGQVEDLLRPSEANQERDASVESQKQMQLKLQLEKLHSQLSQQLKINQRRLAPKLERDLLTVSLEETPPTALLDGELPHDLEASILEAKAQGYEDQILQYGLEVGGKYIKPSLLAKFFVDHKAPWKEKRYQVYIDKLGELLADNNVATKILEDSLVMPENTPLRDFYHNFGKNMRSLLLNAIDGSQGKRKLNQACVDWFTGPQLTDNLKDIVFSLADEGQKILMQASMREVLATKSTLHDKVECVFQALDTLNQESPEFLAPKADLLVGKLWKGTCLFDPLMHTNMPWQYLRQKHQDGEDAKEIIHFRTGVPVGAIKNWASEVVPEYLGLLNGVQQEGKKLVAFLHLDPTMLKTNIISITTSEDPFRDIEYVAEGSYNPLSWLDFSKITWSNWKPEQLILKWSEATWLKLILDLQKQLPDTLDVCVLPFDGDWKKELFSADVQNTAEFSQLLLEKVLLNPKHAFIFSKKLYYAQGELEELAQLRLGSQDPSNFTCGQWTRMQVLEERQASVISYGSTLKSSFRDKTTINDQPIYKFIEGVLQRVQAEFFAHVSAEHKPTKQDKRAFLGIFLSLLQEDIVRKLASDYVQNNCTDGIDRTGEIMGAKIAIDLARAGTLNDVKSQEDFIGQVLAPALAVWKRPILRGRRKIFMAVLQHLHAMAEAGQPFVRPPFWQSSVLPG